MMIDGVESSGRRLCQMLSVWNRDPMTTTMRVVFVYPSASLKELQAAHPRPENGVSCVVGLGACLLRHVTRYLEGPLPTKP